MNKRIRKKRKLEVKLAAVATLALATSASLDGLAEIVEDLVGRLEQFEGVHSQNIQSTNRLFELQDKQIRNLQEQVESLQKTKPWYKRR